MVNELRLQRASGSNGAGKVMLIVLLVALLAAAAAVAPALHADVKHGSEAGMARQCGDGNHHFFLFHNAATNRYGTVCDLGGIWGIVIVDDQGHEITAFVKNKMTRFEQVLKYMRNAGYELIH